MSSQHIAIINYPGALQSAVHGLTEMFLLANRLGGREYFVVRQLVVEALPADASGFQAVILPPSLQQQYYLQPGAELLDWLRQAHAQGCRLCSACAGAFILAATGLVQARSLTTHWDLATLFRRHFPEIELAIDHNLKNDGDILSAGGLMAWTDLGLELVSLFASPLLVPKLGAYLIIDTARREQRFYQRFEPPLQHGDKQILKLQHHLQAHFAQAHSVAAMAASCYLTERTFLRRFVKATGYKPSQYLQRLRIQHACELLAQPQLPLIQVAFAVGYEDNSAFRKAFAQITGLNPAAFRSRFSRSGPEGKEGKEDSQAGPNRL